MKRKLFTLFAICVMAVTSAWADDANLLSGKFSVSATKKVQFTKGNLWYGKNDASSTTETAAYHLESAQNATYGTGDGTYNADHVYHFFWSNTTDWQTTGKEPWASSYSYSAQATTDKFFCGEENKMAVDGTEGLYALTSGSSGEWNYLINSRTNASSLYKCGVSVTTSAGTVTNCLVIAPDNYSGTIAASYTAEEWATAEAAGLVCLPAAGYRKGSDLYNGGGDGYYGSATPDEDYKSNVYLLNFDISGVYPASFGNRDDGYSIRLVKTAPVCKIGDIEYYSVQYAIAKVTEGQTIQLTMDIDLTATITVASTTPAFTLDLNGHVLNAGNISPAGSVVENNGTLTITDSSTNGGGKITGAKSDKGGVYTSNDNLTLSGKIIITGNTKADGTTPCDLYLNGASSTPRTVTLGTLATGASIGVTTAMDGTVGTYKFTTNGSETDAQYFTSDNSDYKVRYNVADYLETVAKSTAINNVNADVDVNKAQGIIKTANYIIKNGKKYNYAGQQVK